MPPRRSSSRRGRWLQIHRRWRGLRGTYRSLPVAWAWRGRSPDRSVGYEGQVCEVRRAHDALDPTGTEPIVSRADPARFHVHDALLWADDFPSVNGEHSMLAPFLRDPMQLHDFVPPGSK